MISLKKIITAVGNVLINDSLKSKEAYVVQTPDIQLEDDLIEALKNRKDTEVLILNIEIIKNNNIYNYINKIKQINTFIKIIALVPNENEEIKNILFANGVKDIFYGNEITIPKLEEAINRNKTTEEILAEEVNSLKEIILNGNSNKSKLNRIKNSNLLNFKIIKRAK